MAAFSPQALANVTVFACEPEYGALAKEIAPQAKIYNATTALQDPHQVQARPSLISQLRRADLAICAGADLEIGWLPMVQMKANNPEVRNGQSGMLFASDVIENLDIPASVDRSMGDVHALGNPHMHFDPKRMLQVAEEVNNRLASIDPDNAASYQANLDDFSKRWQTATEQWQTKAASLKGSKVIGYHSSFRYLYNWLGMKQVADLEPKPGLPPTSAHLAKLVKVAEQQKPIGIIVASYQDPRGAEWLENRTGVKGEILPMSVGADDSVTDLFTLYDSVINKLLELKSNHG
nr:zinc ABC transporter substrate-binding protein [Paraferrimonas haliotis]